MIMLSCNNVCKSFGVDTVLENISFSIEEGDKVGIVGVNGTGKTTLFKILTGDYGYDSGDIYTAKNCKIGYLQQNTNFYSERTVYEEVLSVFENLIRAEDELRELEHSIAELSKNVDASSKKLKMMMDEYGKKYEEFEKNNGYGFRSEVMGILRGLGFNDEDMHKQVNVLSGGEKTRVLLGKLLLLKPSLLLLDEPTNHLDSDAIEWLEGFLRGYDGTVMIISHDRYFLDQSVNRIFEISRKHLTAYNGNYTKYIEQSKIQREIDIRRYENQQRDIKKQEESIERLKAYGREKHLKRARSKEKMLEKVERIDKPQEYRKKARFRFSQTQSSGNDVLQVKDLSKSFDDKLLFEHVDFNIYRGEKVALIGPNGIGKSTIFKIIMDKAIENMIESGNISKNAANSGMADTISLDGSIGKIAKYDRNEGDSIVEGDIKIGKNVDIAYFHQEQKTLNLNNTIIDEIWDANPQLTQTEVRSLLGAFLFEDEDVFKKIKSLSGGERSRIAILKLILSKSNLLLLDEPTNHLDIDSKEVLEEALKEYDGTIFTISHDRYFLNTVVDKILLLSKEGITEYIGNYDYYIEKKNQQKGMHDHFNSEQDTQEKTKTRLKEERKKEKEKKQLENMAKKAVRDLENEISIVEKQISGLEYMLCQEEIYSDPEKLIEVNMEKADLEKKLEKLFERWEEIAE